MCILVNSTSLAMAQSGRKALRVCSYNSHGLGAGRIEYMKFLMNECDVLMVQEHWLLKEQIPTFVKHFPKSVVHAVSGMQSNVLVSGRPHGGCAILVNSRWPVKVVPIEMQNCRVCALRVDTGSFSILFFDVYMPCDTDYDSQNNEEYRCILAEIISVCEMYPSENVVIGGDFNTCLERQNSLHTRSLKEFMNVNSFSCCLLHPASSVDYTFESKIDGSRSTVDHFLLSEVLHNRLLKYSVIDSGENMSDHVAILAEIEFEMFCAHESPALDTGFTMSWKFADDGDILLYRTMIEFKLLSLPVPNDAFECYDVSCGLHVDCIERYYNEVCKACIDSAAHLKRRKGRPVLAGWNEHVKEHKERALFWHKIWKDCGSPAAGLLFDIRKSTRKRYHAALKQLIADQNRAQMSKMAEALLTDDQRDLWTEVRKIRSAHMNNVRVVDGQQDDNICSHFAEKYKSLYNSVPYDQEEMGSLQRNVEQLIESECLNERCYCSHEITPTRVKKAVSKLRAGKHDGKKEFFTDHLRNAPESLYYVLANLFNAMIVHSVIPSDFHLSTLLPIPKNCKKSLSNSDNYRAIAMSSVMGKLLDHILLDIHSQVLASSDLQFGFKPDHSTVMCNFVLQETVQHYVSNGSKVFCLSLDATKAFDRVSYSKLFELLVRRGTCPLTVRFLLKMYLMQKIRVKWNNDLSDEYPISNGVKQGGVLSPILFAVYLDELLLHLKEKDVGCHMGEIFSGAVAYADDVCLLSPSLQGLREMLSVVESLARMYCIQFNAEKSVLLVFDNQDRTPYTLKLFGQMITSTDVVCTKHLGLYIGQRGLQKSIECAVADLYARTNCLSAQFRHVGWRIRLVLFFSFCVHLYGCESWDLTSRFVDNFSVAFRKCIRYILRLPYRTHNRLLPLICERRAIDVCIMNRISKFCAKLMLSKNTLVKTCANFMRHSSGSPISNSVSTICSKFSVERERLFDCCNIFDSFDDAISNSDDRMVAFVISELLDCRDGTQILPNYTLPDIDEMIQALCEH